MDARVKSKFSIKKNRVNFILSIMVFWVHISSFANYDINNSFILGFRSLLDAIIQVAVPLFFIMSGVMFFRNYTYAKTWEKYKSRFFSLVIPYLIWNILSVCFSIVCSYTFIRNYFIGREVFTLTPQNLLLGIFFWKCNGPLWFLCDLIIFTLLCPVIYTLLKNRYIGIIIIIVTYVVTALGYGLPAFLFFRPDSIIFYLIGAYIGLHGFSWFEKNYSKKEKVFAGGVVLASMGLTYMRVYFESDVYGKLYPLILVLFSLALWILLDVLKYRRNYRIEYDSFLLYVTHIHIGGIVVKLLYLLLPKNQWFSMANWALATVGTICIVGALGMCMRKIMPKASRLFGVVRV